MDNQLAVKDRIAKRMALDFRGEYPVCCAVCAHTCWKYKSYKVFCHELPPICKRVLVYIENDLSECTRKFYDLTERILNKQSNKGYKNIFLHPESLNHLGNKNATRLTQHFYFCEMCTRSLACQIGKRTPQLIKPKYSIVNGHITGQIDINDLRNITFPESQMFCQLHSIGLCTNIVSRGIHEFGLSHTFEIEPLKLFSECPIPAEEINLKIIITGSFTKTDLIKKLKPYTVNKHRIQRIFDALKTNGFKRYIDIGSLNKHNLDTYPDDENTVPEEFYMRGPMTRSRRKRIRLEEKKNRGSKKSENCSRYKCG